jgi:hypothetical protein
MAIIIWQSDIKISDFDAFVLVVAKTLVLCSGWTQDILRAATGRRCDSSA